MDRRICLSTIVATAAHTALQSSSAATGSVELDMDLDVIPADENEFLSNFQTIFVPTIRNHRGLQNVRIMKLKKVTTGVKPVGSYRVVLRFESEELWRDWVASTDHRHRAWPAIERTLQPNGITAILYYVL
jgi:heme-degrading monooxygenase HmoA